VNRAPSKPGASGAHESADGAGEEKPTYLQDLYTVFWMPIFVCFAIGNIVLAVMIVRGLWQDPVRELYGLAMLLGVGAGYFELEWLARLLKLDSGPIFDWRLRVFTLSFIGYILGVVVMVSLVVLVSKDQTRARESERQRELDRELYSNTLNDPSVQRGIEALRRHQEAKRRTTE
jgi:hypothetical protein